ncbi:LPXTG cell wall anchor domain-containing protein [Enterococcus hirae]|uniref:LPXTG cell wall anchor domain-containing protein n=1 Tax=Enterococcus hirae TaxID=1354 RepID=A0A7Z9ASP9_ENTHR|nr:LPXTG cell wall anchor domain-containing protein [Enterococcus hirae]EMF0378215.1 LPXTG cell wall anchor domain-containing protein [Enterococcus hirae]EMF0513172.1 LPXTG cell wall anchor domain-containing protein [Enterococcus hirae]EOH67578.1 LPXTG-domain-containing protein cell wall anchor domain [Enterococcus hirae ATCC 9790]EOU06050.1 hypothetical protein I584_01953 [Enterococcus hirae ATCC 9790]MBA5281949.1 LPXTG cell wall anchor domain-containing protein [Enterococcus hirae]
MKKALLSSVALLSLICASPVVYGETTSDSGPQKTTVSSVEKNSTTTSSTTPVKDSSTSSTTSSSTKDSTSSSSSAKTETSTTSKLETQNSTQASSSTTSRSTTKSSTSSSTESSSTTNSSTQETTQSSASPVTTLKATSKSYGVKPGVTISKNELLQLITYTNGDKNNLDVIITSNYAYISKNGQQNSKVYYTDLNALIGPANLNNIQVMTIAQALKLGFTPAQGNANKNIEVINCSLPGQYKITFRDRKTGLSTTTTVTVGNPASAVVSGNTQNSGTVNQTTMTTSSSTVATPKTNNATTKSPAPIATKSSVGTTKKNPVSTSKYTMPKTGEKVNHILSTAGVLMTLIVGSVALIWKF